MAGRQLGDGLSLGGVGDPLRLEQGQRVHLDVISDDEFQPGQAHPVAGNGRELEGLLRVAHTYQDLGVGDGQIANGLLRDAERQGAPVDPAHIAFTAADGDGVAILDALGAIAGADDGRNAHLAGNDRCMAGAAALVGHHAAGSLEDRLPVGICAFGDQ